MFRIIEYKTSEYKNLQSFFLACKYSDGLEENREAWLSFINKTQLRTKFPSDGLEENREAAMAILHKQNTTKN